MMLGCGKEGEVKLMKSGTQSLSQGVLDEIKAALEKDHLTLAVETAS